MIFIRYALYELYNFVILLYFQPDDVVNVATDKINNLLESFMGINDAELGE